MKFLFLLILLFSLGCYSPSKPNLINQDENIKIQTIINPGPEPINSILKGALTLLWKPCEYPQILKVGGMTVLEDGRLFISDMIANKIIIYSPNFTDCGNISYFSNNQFNKPIDIASNDKNIFILDGKDKLIHQIDYNLTTVQEIPLPFSDNPSKIHTNNQFIFIIDSPAHSIFILDLNGNLLKTITSLGNNKLTYPIDITSSSNDTYFIIDGGQRKIFEVDLNFNIISNSFNNQFQTSFPVSIQQSENGIIYINDMVMRTIKILLPNGIIVNQINEKIINDFSPTAIQLIDNSHLVIFNSKDHSLYFVEIKI